MVQISPVEKVGRIGGVPSGKLQVWTVCITPPSPLLTPFIPTTLTINTNHWVLTIFQTDY
jgi:hypothetical protein